MNGRKRILIIEDHDSIRLLLGAILKKNFEVVTKKDGLEGMAWLVKGNLPDLILLDMTMPRLTGSEFLKNIRRSGFFRDIPVIIVSGNDQEEEKKECLRWGVSYYFAKPFNPMLLKEKINAVLTSRQEEVLN